MTLNRKKQVYLLYSIKIKVIVTNDVEEIAQRDGWAHKLIVEVILSEFCFQFRGRYFRG